MYLLKMFLQEQRKLFESRGVESPALSAELLLAEALGIERAALLKLLLQEPDRPLGEPQLARYRSFMERRLAGEPVAYILGRKEFYGREFLVNASTLVPRPETELLIDTALQEFNGQAQGSYADLGTGSGCIAVTLALELGPGWRGLALDVSEAALEVARRNAANLGLGAQVEFLRADFTEYALAPASLDLLASNPPYVSAEEFAGLGRGVRDYEPRGALVPSAGGERGTEDLLAIAALAKKALKPGGLLLMEMGWKQGKELSVALSAAGVWRDIRVVKDLAGLDRLLFARLNVGEC